MIFDLVVDIVLLKREKFVSLLKKEKLEKL
jgi:hypothetical protein